VQGIESKCHKKMFKKIGTILFNFRNILFPVFYAALFIPSPVIFQSTGWAIKTGSLVIGIGILIRCITIGLVYIIRGGLKRQIYAETLVTDGMYRVCRNPMYLGNITLLFGFGLFANSLLFTLIFCPLFAFFYSAIISAEEDFLLKKFGQQFIEYKAGTNAIVPNLGNIEIAFKGQTFKWGKVIYKEYNSLFLYFTGISIILFYRGHLETNIFMIVETIFIVLYFFIKTLKHNKLSESSS
jgi:protein-S-isoprenylcysteine O-methyltransferase Ste14